jgi:hypothetical protein
VLKFGLKVLKLENELDELDDGRKNGTYNGTRPRERKDENLGDLRKLDGVDS